MNSILRNSLPILMGSLFALQVLPSAKGTACTPSAQEKAVSAAPLADRPMDAAHRELLEASFRAAQAMPQNPHLKTRSRVQEEIVDACLDLDQPLLALEGLKQIENWRRGVAYAKLAYYCAEENNEKAARGFLIKAAAIAENPGDATEQTWRRDRIRSHIALSYRLLGDSARAANFEENILASESNDLAEAEASTMDTESFEKHLQAIDKVIQAGDFDTIQAALLGCATLHDRFYSNPERRQQCEEKIASSSTRIPLQVRIEIMLRLGEQAAKHGDSAHALEFVSQAKETMDTNHLSQQSSIPLRSRLIQLRFQTGDKAKALREADAQFEVFHNGEGFLADVFQAETLRPLAEAYEHMDAHEKALEVYRKVVQVGSHNPNGRPQLEDTVATCLSIARNKVLLDQDLKQTLLKVFSDLKAPW